MSIPSKNRLMDGALPPSEPPRYLGASLEDLQAKLWKLLEEKVYGLCFGAYLPGQSPDLKTQLSEEQIRARMEIIAPYCRWIRTFSCTDGNEHAPKVAHELGLKTMVGAWIEGDAEKNKVEIQALIDVARAGHADMLAVGNEVLLREELSEDELIALIQEVKAAVPGVPVGYVDAYYLFGEHPRLVEACDALFINCYPFWEKFNLESSVGYMREMVTRVKNISDGKPVIISETGWPTAGSPVGAAVPSMENAWIYALNAFEWTAQEDIPLFYFSSFDEAWKTGPEGDCGAFWGFWDEAGNPKNGA